MRHIPIVATLLVAAALAPATALAVPDGGIELVSRPTGFGSLPFDGVSQATVGPHAMSGDGCKVVFQSDNDVLSTLDIDVYPNIFLVDRCTPGQPVTLVSMAADGAPADGGASQPSISADGRRVAFTTSSRNLLPAGTTVNSSVVVKDLPSGNVILASRDHGADGQAATAYRGVISGDGKSVAFSGRGPVAAINATGTANFDDVYVRFLAGGQTVMASAKGSVAGSAAAFDISDDGGRVAFTSNEKLVAGDGDYDYDAYIADVTPAGNVTQRLVSGAQATYQVAISGDGKQVGFADDRVWVASCATDPCGAPVQLDGAPAGTGQRISGLDFPAAPAAAGLMSWTTDRALLPADTNSRADLYAASLPAGQIVLPFGTTPNGTSGGAVKGDLSVVVAESSSLDLPGTDGVGVQVFARSNGETALLSQPADQAARRNETSSSYAEPGSVSNNGRLVAMGTTSPALGAPLLPGTQRWTREIALRDVLTGVTSLVSVGPDGTPGDGSSRSPRVDAAGSRVVFASKAANLVPGVPAATGIRHIYARDLATGTTQLVDRKPDGSPISVGADTPDISNDGTKVAFISGSPDLPGPGTGNHAYVADLATGAITLVDQTAAGQAGNNSAYEVVLDGDGTRAAFISSATNLGTTDPGDKVFLKDLTSGEVTYVSVPESGTPEQGATGVSIDAAGNRVAWEERIATFGYGSDGRSHIFARDLVAGVTKLASVDGGSADFGGELDASGTRLAFISGSGEGPSYVERPYVRDLAAGVTVSLLPDSSRGAFDIALSPDGICAAVGSDSPDLIAGNPSPDFDQVYLRAVGGACTPRPDAGGGGGAGAAVDTTPPAISKLRMTHRRFKVRRNASAFLFSLTEDSRASVAIARCVKLRKSACRRYRVVATLTRAHAKLGRNRIAFSGRIGKRKLAPGRYRATVGAVDAAGNRALPRRVRFNIVRR